MKNSLGLGRKQPLAGETSGPTPRYTYAKPTDKAQHGMPANPGTDIENYYLPVIDTQTERRNFPGYTEAEYFTMVDIQEGDQSGATDTDAATHKMMGKNTGGGYTKINQTSGPTGRSTRRS